MNINSLVKSKALRVRQIDKPKINSMIESALENVGVVMKIQLNEKSATIIFREIYESIRQLGDANWWLLGYEPLSHEVTIELLKSLDIKDKIKLNYLDRFRKIRNDANYRGFRISVAQANEIIEFWKFCSEDIINIIKNKLGK